VKIHIKKKILQSLCRLQKPLKYTYFLSCGFGKKYDSERGGGQKYESPKQLIYTPV